MTAYEGRGEKKSGKGKEWLRGIDGCIMEKKSRLKRVKGVEPEKMENGGLWRGEKSGEGKDWLRGFDNSV